MLLPLSLMPADRPILTLLGMTEKQFCDLYFGDGNEGDVIEPDRSIIRAFSDLVEERAQALLADWQHREATIDIVECFAAIASEVAAIDTTIVAVSRWLSAIGPQTTLRALGLRLQTAEQMALITLDRLTESDWSDGDPLDNHFMAVAAVVALGETMTLHLALGDIWVTVALQADRVRVIVDLPDEGEVDMGGHHFDGDEDSDASPSSSPLIAA